VPTIKRSPLHFTQMTTNNREYSSGEFLPSGPNGSTPKMPPE